MPTRSWFPSTSMIRALMLSHGFRESPLEVDRQYTRAIGGRAVFRDHPDGRLQMLYVGAWSNHRIAERQGVLPCNLAVRPTLDVLMPERVAWLAAPHGDQHISLWFSGKDDWSSACAQFASVIMPLLDSPCVDDNTLAGIGVWSPEKVARAREIRQQVGVHLAQSPGLP